MKRLYNRGVAVLASGGLDSCVLIGDLARTRTVVPIYIRQGLAWEDVELDSLRRFLKALHNSPRLPAGRQVKPLRVFELPMGDVYGNHWSLGKKKVPGARTPDKAVYLPGRNIVLGVKAAVYCALHQIPALALGPLNHNPFPDATPEFFKSWARTLGMGLGRPIRIETPFRRFSKADVIQRGKDFPLELSFSCLSPVGKLHCGRCNKCAERQKAFRRAGVEDRTRYAKN